ncbi:MAG: hypothetical protein JKY22_02745 [Flavobacteriaceae bacterium]|nr:hypothetical protein [Flavobacteriaceae bacterium]
MNNAVSKGKAALAEEDGKLKKLLKAIKKLFAKEFLWILFVLLVSIPLALIVEYLLCKIGDSGIAVDPLMSLIEGYSLFMVSYGVSIAGFYFSRMVVGAIKTLTEKKE